MTRPVGDARPAKKGIPGWAIALILTFVGLPFLAGVVGTVAIVVPKMRESQRRTGCMNNLAQLGQIWLVQTQMDPRHAQPYSGPAALLAFRKDGARVRRGDERIFVCAGDPAGHVPETEADRNAYDDVDLAKVPRSLCSYAVRDFRAFPLGDGDEKEPIAACLNHRRGAVVLFEGGDVQFVSLEKFGLSEYEDMIVGPDSKSPMLRKLRFGDGSTR